MLLNSYLRKYVHNSIYSWKSTERNYIGPKYETQFVKIVRSYLVVESVSSSRFVWCTQPNWTSDDSLVGLSRKERKKTEQRSDAFSPFFQQRVMYWCRVSLLPRGLAAASVLFKALGLSTITSFYDIWSACEYRLTCVVAKLDQFWVGENCLFVKKFYKKKLFTFC